MPIGALAHLFGTLPYEQLAEKIGASGIRHVQLALWKAFSDRDYSKVGTLNDELVGDIAKAFEKHDVSISALGCYLHLFEQNEWKRRQNIERFKELIRYAPQFGSSIVAAETGKIQSETNQKKDWNRLRETLEELAEEAEKYDVCIGVEPANDHLIDSAFSMKQMMKEVTSSKMGVVLDPGNLITADNIHNQKQIIEHAFELLGEHIVACHAKDRLVTDDKRIESVAPGKGQMNYHLFLQQLQAYKPQAPIIMEWVPQEEILESKSFIEAIQKEVVKL